VNNDKLTALGFPVHSHAQQRCFQQTLRFGDVLVLADYRLFIEPVGFEFGHQTSNSRLGRAVVAKIKIT